MSTLSATALSPLLQSLSPEELEKLIAQAQQLLPKNHKPKRKTPKDIYANMPDYFRPENIETLVQMIMADAKF